MEIGMIKEIPEGLHMSRSSTNYLKNIIDSISDPILVIDPDHKVKFANQASKRIFDVKDPVGMHLSCYQVIHRLERPCETSSAWIFSCPLRDVISTKEPVRLIHKYLDKSESEVIIEVSACPIFNDTGEVIQTVAIIRDITKIRQEEEGRERLILDLQKAYSEFDLQRVITKRYSDLIPVCMCCKKMRNSRGIWKNIEEFIRDYWKVEFTHGICPECEKTLYDADKDGKG